MGLGPPGEEGRRNGSGAWAVGTSLLTHTAAAIQGGVNNNPWGANAIIKVDSSNYSILLHCPEVKLTRGS